MTANQKIAGLTFVAAVLLLVGAADADELADLRAQMAVLRQKMDQVAQFAPGSTGAAAYGTKAVPGANIIGGSFPRSFLIPGTDTSIRVGGFVAETINYFIQ